MRNLHTSIPMSVMVAFSAFACGSALGADDDVAAKGLAILGKNCARCHALGLTGASTHPQAPPFRDVVKRYPVEDLEESLAEGIVSGHPDMPEFTFEPNEINAILAYLNSLKAQENGK
jgi:mono/diheme cytochrome c family protein